MPKSAKFVVPETEGFFVKLLDQNSDPIDIAKVSLPVNVEDNLTNRVTEASKDAFWMLIGTDPEAKVVTIGSTNAAASRPAINFIKDMLKFHLYDHPLTDWKIGRHIYKGVDETLSYVENAGVMLINDLWWRISIRNNGHRMFEPYAMLDGTSHEQEIEVRMIANKQPDYKIAEAKKKEHNRAYQDYRRILKHQWGFSFGETFKVRVRFMPDFAAKAFLIMVEPDLDKAWEMRQQLIFGYVARQKYVRGKFHRPSEPTTEEPEGDTPDFAADQTEKDAPAPADVPQLIFPAALDGKLTNTMIDLNKVEPETLVTLWIIQKSGLYYGNWSQHWNARSKTMFEDLKNAAEENAKSAKPVYALEVSESQLAVAQI